jgi:hypothetical protein
MYLRRPKKVWTDIINAGDDKADMTESLLEMSESLLVGSQVQRSVLSADELVLEQMGHIWDSARMDQDCLEACYEIAEAFPDVPFEYTTVRFFQPEKKVRRQHAALNLVTAAQVLWQAKHGITDAAMKDWITMSRAPWWNAKMLRSGGIVRGKRELFPLLPLYSLDVKTSTPSHFDSAGYWIETTYAELSFCSIVDVICRMLTTPGMLDQLTVVAKTGPIVKEVWHGRIFRECGLFTPHRIRMSNKLYHIGDTFTFLAPRSATHLPLEWNCSRRGKW